MPAITRSVAVNAIEIPLLELGSGRPLLFLHSGEGPDTYSSAYLEGLAKRFRVIAPWHPGFGSTIRPPSFKDPSDLAYFYLDFMEQEGLVNTLLVGASFGGWIATEMAVRSVARIAALVLIDPFGIRVSEPWVRDIEDMFAMSDAQWAQLAFEDSTHSIRDIAAMSDEQVAMLVRGRDALSFYGWKPYMHNPQLIHWLHRIRVPALLMRGARDRVVRKACHERFAQLLPMGQMKEIAGAGHYPHIEKAQDVVDQIISFSDLKLAPATAAN
ncbi:MAG: alpha/beta fold hydrolase [Burkholderiales bacterium]